MCLLPHCLELDEVSKSPRTSSGSCKGCNPLGVPALLSWSEPPPPQRWLPGTLTLEDLDTSYLFAWLSSHPKSQLCFAMQLKRLSADKETRPLLLLPRANKGQR